MAGFCGNCGSKLDEGARVCGQCGVPVDDNDFRSFKYVDSEKQKKVRKRLKVGFILLIVIVFVIIGINVTLNYTGKKGFIRKVMKAYEEYDIDTLVDLSSDAFLYSEYDDYADEYFERIVALRIDDIEETVGHNYKLTYEIDEIYNIDNRAFDNEMDTLEERYPDFDVDTIKKVSVAEIKITAKQGGRSIHRTLNITMSKEKNQWKLLDLN